ncbi:hypothetical protein [Ornithinimicrobium cryptoxanthini]|uniref:hypothetical protein n=1 Tax=Ornithinimicrobium cryptoxanthini TaxID=2934161 RepID=UPI0021193736|nr:hypothetical protein [Ornithinimicrobium cryptoxanthini]
MTGARRANAGAVNFDERDMHRDHAEMRQRGAGAAGGCGASDAPRPPGPRLCR